MYTLLCRFHLSNKINNKSKKKMYVFQFVNNKIPKKIRSSN